MTQIALKAHELMPTTRTLEARAATAAWAHAVLGMSGAVQTEVVNDLTLSELLRMTALDSVLASL